jgi:hypothetical protein
MIGGGCRTALAPAGPALSGGAGQPELTVDFRTFLDSTGLLPEYLPLAEHQFRGRREDQRLVTGTGRYTDDWHFDGEVAGHFLRADRAHARIRSIDVAEARKLAGVIDIVTGADMAATGWKSAPVMAFFKGVGGSSVKVPFRCALAHERVS